MLPKHVPAAEHSGINSSACLFGLASLLASLLRAATPDEGLFEGRRNAVLPIRRASAQRFWISAGGPRSVRSFSISNGCESPLDPATRSVPSGLWIWIKAALKLVSSVIAEAMSGQIVSGAAPLSKRAVIAEN